MSQQDFRLMWIGMLLEENDYLLDPTEAKVEELKAQRPKSRKRSRAA